MFWQWHFYLAVEFSSPTSGNPSCSACYTRIRKLSPLSIVVRSTHTHTQTTDWQWYKMCAESGVKFWVLHRLLFSQISQTIWNFIFGWSLTDSLLFVNTHIHKVVLHDMHCSTICITDYGRPVRKSPSLHGRKSTPTPKFLSTAEAYFVCHIRPIFSDIFDLCLHWVSVVRVCYVVALFKIFCITR